MALAQVLLCVSFAPPPLGLLRPSPAALAAPRTSPPQLLDEKQLEQELDVWRLREGMIRGAYGVLVNWKEDEREERAQRDTAGADSTVDATRSAFVASATAVVVGALVLRLGGRAALVSVLGLDMVADLGIDEKVNEFVAYASALGPLSVLGFAAAWVAAKVFLLDFISIGLALSSGILFGGVFQGALLSTTCATLGSLVGFNLSRGNLQKRVESAVQGQPVARALAKVVEEDGFKTVFVLRLAPIIPALPLGAYPYIYGASNLSAVPFATATFLGGIKPYLIDSYVGVFSKQILDGDQMDSGVQCRREHPLRMQSAISNQQSAIRNQLSAINYHPRRMAHASLSPSLTSHPSLSAALHAYLSLSRLTSISCHSRLSPATRPPLARLSFVSRPRQPRTPSCWSASAPSS